MLTASSYIAVFLVILVVTTHSITDSQKKIWRVILSEFLQGDQILSVSLSFKVSFAGYKLLAHIFFHSVS